MDETTAAMQQMAQRAYAGPSSGLGNIAQAQEPELVRAISETQSLGKMAAEARAMLEEFDARLRGNGVTESCDTAGAKIGGFGSGLLGELRRAISEAQETVDDVLRTARQLRSIG